MDSQRTLGGGAPGYPLVNQIGKAPTFGPHIFDFPKIWKWLCHMFGLGNKNSILTQNSSLLFLVYQAPCWLSTQGVLLPLTSNGLTNALGGRDRATYTLGTFSVTRLHLRQLSDGDLCHEILTYSDEVPCYWDTLADLIFPSLYNRNSLTDILKLCCSTVENNGIFSSIQV